MKKSTVGMFIGLSVLISGIARADESQAAKPAPQVRSTTNPGVRADPYRNYRFRVSIGGVDVAGFSEFRQVSVPSAVPTGVSASRHGGSGVPVQVPGSLVGRSGTVTLICSVAPNNAAATTANVTLLCSYPITNGSADSAAMKPPGRSKFDAITLERGVTHDSSFENWASSVGGGSRRDLVVNLFNEAGVKTGEYRLRRCLVVTFQGLPGLDAGTPAVSIAALEFHCDPVVKH